MLDNNADAVLCWLERVDETTAYFADGTSKKVDAIILCTGYKHHFPFLPDDLRLKTKNRLATADLYKGVVWVNNPKLFYLGMQDQWFTFNMFDAQAWWVRDAIMGKIKIPTDKAVLLKDVADRVAGEDAGKDAHDAIHYQGDYVKELIAETDYPSFDVDGACEAFFEWKDHKKQDIMAFRNNAYKSVITGTMAPTSGHVRLFGRDVTHTTPQQRNIAQVFQFPVIYDTMTVAENLAFPLKNRKVPAAEIRERVGRIAEMLEMSHQLDMRAAGLSALAAVPAIGDGAKGATMAAKASSTARAAKPGTRAGAEWVLSCVRGRLASEGQSLKGQSLKGQSLRLIGDCPLGDCP